MYLQEDQQRDALLKSPTPAQPAAGGFQPRASRAAAPSPFTPSTTPSNAPSNAVAVTRQPNGVLEFSGSNVSGDVTFTGNSGFKPSGFGVTVLPAETFGSAPASVQASLSNARQAAMQRGDLDAVARSLGEQGGRGVRGFAPTQTQIQAQPATPAASNDWNSRITRDNLLREATTKKNGESRADFATRSNAILKSMGYDVDERNNIRGNQTQQRGQNLGFATSEAERQSRELLEARRQKLDDQRLGLDAGRLQLDAFKATQPEAQKAPAGYRWSEQGNLQAIPGGPGDKSQALRPMPSSAAGGLLENRRNARRAVDALALLNGETLPGGTKGDPNATGLKGYLPNQILNRLDPAGVDTRAAIADLGSMVINDRSGAAVTAAEFPRLAPFIPSEKDDPETARKKLQNFARNYGAIVNDTEEFYRASGYNVPDAETTQQPAPAPARQSGPAAVPQAGQVVRGYRFLGGDPSDRNNWEAGQ